MTPKPTPVALLPTSWGDVYDKLTILEIKSSLITDKQKLVNVQRERSEIERVIKSDASVVEGLADLVEELSKTNRALWDIEDKLRALERTQSFGNEFIQLARSVYLRNDQRALLKKQINVLLDSGIVEEKHYLAAEAPPAANDNPSSSQE